MKKSIFTIIIFLSAFGAIFTSCEEDEIISDEPTGKYKVILDGAVFEGETTEVGMLENTISLSEGEDFGILIGNVPETVGNTIQIGGDGEEEVGSVSIYGINLLLDDGSDEMYFSFSGSIKRESSSKVSFSGNCSPLLESTSYSFSGTVESDVYKAI